VATLVNVTGVTGFGNTGASIPVELEAGGFLLLESGFAIARESTAPADIVAGTGVNVSVTGVAGTSGINGVTVIGDANILPAGLAATGEVSGVTIVAGTGIDVFPVGVSGAASVGAVDVEADATAPVTGLEATASVGGVTVIGAAEVSLTGLEATGEVGSLSITGDAVVRLTGVEVSAETSRVFVWGDFDPGVSTLWRPLGRELILLENNGDILLETNVGADGSFIIQEVSTSATEWSTITPSTTSNWAPVAA